MSALEFWNAGHKISGFDAYYGSAFVGMRKFRQLFGTTPMICAIIWQLLDVKGCLPLRTKPLHMLCALLFLKVYGTEEVHSAMTGLTEKTFRKWSTIYIELIAQELDVVRHNYCLIC